MVYKIIRGRDYLKGEIDIVSSKSESNRVLIINALSDKSFKINNISNSDDTAVLKKALQKIKSNKVSQSGICEIDIGNCGTAMRFLTALLSIGKGKYILTGSERMQQRPIGTLVDSLNSLGAKITYLNRNGYPPLKIEGSRFDGKEISVDSSVSSQFISALLIISPLLPNGLRVILKEKIISLPYIRMTLEIMKYFGVKSSWENNTIEVPHQNYIAKDFEVGWDWSAVSYWYELASFSKDVNLTIKGLKRNGLQGDEIVSELFEKLGVDTRFNDNGVVLTRNKNAADTFEYDFTNNPDLAQTLGVTCAGLNIKCELHGLDNLTLKECNRIEALGLELSKLGFNVVNSNNKSISIEPSAILMLSNQQINTYNDHRMALSFAPLALKYGEIIIKSPEVVSKSYPDFWNQLMMLGFEIEEC